jgi:hypothetical protein
MAAIMRELLFAGMALVALVLIIVDFRVNPDTQPREKTDPVECDGGEKGEPDRHITVWRWMDSDGNWKETKI